MNPFSRFFAISCQFLANFFADFSRFYFCRNSLTKLRLANSHLISYVIIMRCTVFCAIIGIYYYYYLFLVLLWTPEKWGGECNPRSSKGTRHGHWLLIQPRVPTQNQVDCLIHFHFSLSLYMYIYIYGGGGNPQFLPQLRVTIWPRQPSTKRVGFFLFPSFFFFLLFAFFCLRFFLYPSAFWYLEANNIAHQMRSSAYKGKTGC